MAELRQTRRAKNTVIVIALCWAATIFGLELARADPRVACCGTALPGLSLTLFTQTTPPPGSAGGLVNAIVGSLIMTVLGVRRRRADRACSPAPTWPNTGDTRS